MMRDVGLVAACALSIGEERQKKPPGLGMMELNETQPIGPRIVSWDVRIHGGFEQGAKERGFLAGVGKRVRQEPQKGIGTDHTLPLFRWRARTTSFIQLLATSLAKGFGKAIDKLPIGPRKRRAWGRARIKPKLGHLIRKWLIFRPK